MRVSLVRWIDEHVGTVAVAAVAPFKRRRPAPKAPARVAVAKYFGLGSLLMATPLLQLLRSRFPEAHITVLTFSRNEPLLKSFGFVDEVITIDDRNFLRVTLSTLRAVRKLRKGRVDLFCDLEFFSRYSALVSFLSGAPVRAGFSTSGNSRGRLLSHPVEVHYPMSTVRAFLSQSVALGLLPDEELDVVGARIAALEVDDETRRSLEDRLQSMGIGEYVVFNATAGEAIGREREWAVERWAQLAILVQQRGFDVVLTGEKAKHEEVSRIVAAAASPRVHNFAGSTTFKEFVATVAMARAVVTIDSAALHVAQSVHTPTVSLHGPEMPLVNAYTGPRNRAVHVGTDGATCPCFSFHESKAVHCRFDNRCMRSIEPDAVLGALENVLSGAAAAGAAEPPSPARSRQPALVRAPAGG